MQLPAFISRLALFADKAESQLDQLTKAQSEVTELRSQVKSLTEALATANAKLSGFTSAQDDLSATIKSQADEIAALKASVESEKRKATDLIAAQGLPLEKLPTAGQTGPGEHSGRPDFSKMNETEQCLHVRKNGKK